MFVKIPGSGQSPKQSLHKWHERQAETNRAKELLLDTISLVSDNYAAKLDTK